MGGPSTSVNTYDDHNPKSDSLVNLENRMYGIANNILDAGNTYKTVAPPTGGSYGSGTNWNQTGSAAGAATGNQKQASSTGAWGDKVFGGSPTPTPGMYAAGNDNYLKNMGASNGVYGPKGSGENGQLLNRDVAQYAKDNGLTMTQAQYNAAMARATQTGDQIYYNPGTGMVTINGNYGAEGGTNGGTYFLDTGYDMGGAPTPVIESQPQELNPNSLENRLSNYYDMTGENNRRYQAGQDYGDTLTQKQQNIYDNLPSVGSSYFGQAQKNFDLAETVGDEYYANAMRNFQNAETAGQPWYAKADDALGKAGDYVGNAGAANELGINANKWYDQYAQGQLEGARNTLETGEIPDALRKAMMATVNEGLKGSMGSALSNAAKRGVVNSSVTSKGIGQLSDSAAEAYLGGYNDIWNNVLGGYQGNAQTAANAGRAFADTYINLGNQSLDQANTQLGIGNSYGNLGTAHVNNNLNIGNAYQQAGRGRQQDTLAIANSLQGAGNQAVQNELNRASGYGNMFTQNLANQESLLADQETMWKNAVQPEMTIADYLYNMQRDWANDTKTTVVSQKPGFF